jgi:hypothetical protein
LAENDAVGSETVGRLRFAVSFEELVEELLVSSCCCARTVRVAPKVERRRAAKSVRPVRLGWGVEQRGIGIETRFFRNRLVFMGLFARIDLELRDLPER